jgi:hypothetical protein
MNQYWIVAFLILLSGVGFFGYRAGATSAEVSCQRQVEEQQQHVIGQMETQAKITQGVQNAYHTGIAAIDNLYSTASVQSKADGAVRSIPAAACRTQTSKRYKLTFKQCDDEEFKCNALWNWAQQQSNVH